MQIDDYYIHYYLEKHGKTVKWLNEEEYKNIPVGLLVDIPNDTAKLADKYTKNGVLNSEYVNRAISLISHIQFD